MNAFLQQAFNAQQGLSGLGAFEGLAGTSTWTAANNASFSTNAANTVWMVPVVPVPPSYALPDLNDPIVWLQHRVDEICWKP